MSKPGPHGACHLRGVVLEISSAVSMVDHIQHGYPDGEMREVEQGELDHVVEHLSAASAEYMKASRTVQRAAAFLRSAMHSPNLTQKQRDLRVYRATRMLEKVL